METLFKETLLLNCLFGEISRSFLLYPTSSVKVKYRAIWLLLKEHFVHSTYLGSIHFFETNHPLHSDRFELGCPKGTKITIFCKSVMHSYEKTKNLQLSAMAVLEKAAGMAGSLLPL